MLLNEASHLQPRALKSRKPLSKDIDIKSRFVAKLKASYAVNVFPALKGEDFLDRRATFRPDT